MRVQVQHGDPSGAPPYIRRDFVVITCAAQEVIAYVHYPSDGREPYLVVEAETAGIEIVDGLGQPATTQGDLDEPVNGLKVYGPGGEEEDG